MMETAIRQSRGKEDRKASRRQAQAHAMDMKASAEVDFFYKCVRSASQQATGAARRPTEGMLT